MRLVKLVVGGVGALIALFVVGAYTMPADAVITRTITIAAPATEVFEIVNGFERFHEWSPWSATDAEVRIELHGPRTGAGASMSWVSAHPDVGRGTQQVLSVETDRRVLVAVRVDDFADAHAEFQLEPRGVEATIVTWTHRIDLGYNPILRWFGPLLDSLVGPEHERGLENLKRLAERDTRSL